MLFVAHVARNGNALPVLRFDEAARPWTALVPRGGVPLAEVPGDYEGTANLLGITVGYRTPTAP